MPRLPMRNFKEASFSHSEFRVNPEVGTKLEDVLEPEYWANVSSRVNPHDIITVVPEDTSFYAKLFVLSSGKTSLKVHVIEYTDFSKVAKPARTKLEDFFEIKFAGAAKWRVTRKSDGSVVSNEQLQSRENAEEWLAKNGANLMAA